MKQQDYRSLAEKQDAQLSMLTKRFNQCAFYRVCAVAWACGFLYAGYRLHFWPDYLFALLGVAAFLWLIRQHDRIERAQALTWARREVAQQYVSRLDEKWKSFDQDGGEYLRQDTPQARDLDLFGQSSLFQYICAANTRKGQEELAEWITTCAPADVILSRQQAVRELAEREELGLEIQAYTRAAVVNKKKPGGINESWPAIPSAQQNTVLSILLCLLPMCTILALLGVLFGLGGDWSWGIFGALFGLQFLIALAGYPRNHKALASIERFSSHIKPYQELFARIEGESFASEELQAIQQTFKSDGGACHALQELQRIADFTDLHTNFIAFVLSNGLFLLDFHTVARLHAWQNRYGKAAKRWLNSIGRVEALLSLSVIACVNPRHCFPQVEESMKLFIHLKGVLHPLIPQDQAIGNDFSMEHGTCIITGSNMSGKTTFLRTVGVNLALAYAGGPTLASAFRASRMAVYTSMRIEDSVSQGISSFYAELLRIKEIIDRSQKKEPMLALIDEIYRGTNSKDRILGAAETIRRLAGPQIITMLTTHDFELCDLQQDPAAHAVNYHFSEHYTENEILFDYTIKPGRCQTTNAQHLLRMVGITQ